MSVAFSLPLDALIQAQEALADGMSFPEFKQLMEQLCPIPVAEARVMHVDMTAELVLLGSLLKRYPGTDTTDLGYVMRLVIAGMQFDPVGQ